MASAVEAGNEQAAQAIISELNRLKAAREAIITKISELDGELVEVRLVISNLETLPEDRKCFRMIGEVLVERTAAEVLGALKQNRDNVSNAMGEMAKQLEATERELLAFVKKHNIRQTNDLDAVVSAAKSGGSRGGAGDKGSSGAGGGGEKSTGVLV